MRAAVGLAVVIAGLYMVGIVKAATWKAKAKAVIYGTFPKATRDAAFRVVGCETGYSYRPWSYNSSSGASGIFQILTGNSGRVLRYRGQTLTIRAWYNGQNLLFNPYYNARVALFLSAGGTDWREWSCGWAAR